LQRNIATRHKLGMKVIAYAQCWPGAATGGIQGFLKRMKRAKDVYGLDGLYFDGHAVPRRGEQGWQNDYLLLHEARKFFRDGILIMHHKPRGLYLSQYLDYVHVGEHSGSLAGVISSLSGQSKSRLAIGGLIENAPGMTEDVTRCWKRMSSSDLGL